MLQQLLSPAHYDSKASLLKTFTKLRTAVTQQGANLTSSVLSPHLTYTPSLYTMTFWLNLITGLVFILEEEFGFDQALCYVANSAGSERQFSTMRVTHVRSIANKFGVKQAEKFPFALDRYRAKNCSLLCLPLKPKWTMLLTTVSYNYCI